jgi:peptidyl-tRNA hydrolase
VIVRSDLPLGFLAAQVVHAAGESSQGNLNHGTNAVVLAVPDEPALEAMRLRLEAAGVAHVAIHEPDAPWNGQLTAIGLRPVYDRARLRPLLSSLPLLGRRSDAPAAPDLRRSTAV